MAALPSIGLIVGSNTIHSVTMLLRGREGMQQHHGYRTLHKTWISRSRLLSPAAYRDLSTTCTTKSMGTCQPLCTSRCCCASARAADRHSSNSTAQLLQAARSASLDTHHIGNTLIATGSPVSLSRPLFTTANPAGTMCRRQGCLLPHCNIVTNVLCRTYHPLQPSPRPHSAPENLAQWLRGRAKPQHQTTHTTGVKIMAHNMPTLEPLIAASEDAHCM